MIIPRLKGGLGNQMFAIAAGVSKALDLNTEFKINYNYFPHAGGQGLSPTYFKDTFYKKIQETDHVPKHTYHEPDWSYSPIPDITDMIIDGYFQSGKHFKHNSDYIKKLFDFPIETQTKIKTALTKLPNKKIGVHIRLGDYLGPGYITTHYVCTRDYYLNALKHFNIESDSIIVVTDNVNDYHKYIALENAIVSNSKSELEDLYLLSQCDSVIMSNSSFSWWGVYLGKEKEQVITPNKWFGIDGPKNFSDVYEDSWIKIAP